MKRGIWKRRLLAVAMAAALVVPQGVYAAEELQQPSDQSEEPQMKETADTEEKRLHQEGCLLPLEHEGDCIVNLVEESVVDEGGQVEEVLLSGYESEQDVISKVVTNSRSGLTEDDPMKVPEEGLVIVSGVYYGISKTWFAENNFNKDTLYFSIEIPDSVTKIANDGFRSNYTSDKQKNGAVTTNDKLGDYKVVSIDFTNATELTTIEYQAAKYEPLQGVLDLSNTKITKIEKNAFGDCTGLTGVILPNTLEVLGDEDGASGSVFNGCTGLQFIRTVDSNEDIVFELPKSLRVIGKQTFKNTFPKGSDIIVKIPESVEIIGSEAFYSNSCFSQIFIEH